MWLPNRLTEQDSALVRIIQDLRSYLMAEELLRESLRMRNCYEPLLADSNPSISKRNPKLVEFQSTDAQKNQTDTHHKLRGLLDAILRPIYVLFKGHHPCAVTDTYDVCIIHPGTVPLELA